MEVPFFICVTSFRVNESFVLSEVVKVASDVVLSHIEVLLGIVSAFLRLCAGDITFKIKYELTHINDSITTVCTAEGLKNKLLIHSIYTL